MKISSHRIQQLSSQITVTYLGWLSNASGWTLAEVATTACFGVGLEWDTMIDAHGVVGDVDVEIIETSGTRAKPASNDRALGITGYLPDISLASTTSSAAKLDELLKRWGVALPVEQPGLDDDDDPWGRIERFKILIVSSPTLWPTVRDSLFERIDDGFSAALDDMAEGWLQEVHAKMIAYLLD